jgi:hypothetical protein
MCKVLIAAPLLVGSTAMAADFYEAALKAQMKADCAPLFAPEGACADLAKGTLRCTRENASKGGATCVVFEKAQKAFFRCRHE